MSDSQVTADGQTYPLPQPFMVIATQNPFEFEGTYPLPESQLDRFLLRVAVGYPEREDELQVLNSHRAGEPVQKLQPVLDAAQIIALQQAVREVTMDDSINSYLLDIVDATRRCEELRVGVSTRGALCLYRASQAMALVGNRDYVVPDDVKRLAVPVLSHRVIAKGYLQGTHRQALESLIARLVEEIPVPRERAAAPARLQRNELPWWPANPRCPDPRDKAVRGAQRWHVCPNCGSAGRGCTTRWSSRPFWPARSASS